MVNKSLDTYYILCYIGLGVGKHVVTGALHSHFPERMFHSLARKVTTPRTDRIRLPQPKQSGGIGSTRSCNSNSVRYPSLPAFGGEFLELAALPFGPAGRNGLGSFRSLSSAPSGFRFLNPC